MYVRLVTAKVNNKSFEISSTPLHSTLLYASFSLDRQLSGTKQLFHVTLTTFHLRLFSTSPLPFYMYPPLFVIIFCCSLVLSILSYLYCTLLYFSLLFLIIFNFLSHFHSLFSKHLTFSLLLFSSFPLYLFTSLSHSKLSSFSLRLTRPRPPSLVQIKEISKNFIIYLF